MTAAVASEPRNPARSIPARAPGSIRRTTAHDILLLATGSGRGMVLRASGRDLVTGRDGAATETGRADVLVTIDDRERPVIDRLEIDGRPGPAELIGGPARSGFRRSLGSATGVGAAGSLRFGLLDDIPGAVIISGYLVTVGMAPPRAASAWLTRADVCSGWRSDGTMMAAVRSSGAVPRIDAPSAPDLASGDDLAWHDAPLLQPGEMRRARRMDVLERDGSLIVDAMFRDHYVDRDGAPAIVHEYQLSARVDASGRVTELRADPHVLPWPSARWPSRVPSGWSAGLSATCAAPSRAHSPGHRPAPISTT